MKIYFKLFLIVFSAFTTACTYEEANLFSDSSAIRLEKAQKEYNDILCSASNGWVMEYFPTDTTKGVTFLMKFNMSKAVLIAAKSELTGNSYAKDSSLFDLIADNGPVLTFNTYNKLFHVYSNPEDPAGSSNLDGIGLGGDYEFIVLSADANQISLKGKKRGTYIYLKKLADNQSWPDYFTQIDTENSMLFGSVSNTLNFILGSDTLLAYNGIHHIFEIAKKGDDPILNGEIHSFIVTPTGIRFHTPYLYNDKKIQTFVLSNDKKQLVSSEDPSVLITGPILNKYLYSDFSVWKSNINQMSDNYKTLINNLSEALKTKYAGKRNFEYIALTNKAVYSNSLYLRVTGIDAIYRILYSPVSGTSDRVKISLPEDNFNLYDNNGKKFYNEVSEINTTLTGFCGEYIVSSEFPLAVQNVKYTRVDNLSQYFIVSR